MANKYYVGDIGTVIDVDLGENISTATSVAFSILKPDGTTETWEAEIYADNYLRYATQEGDLDQAGTYKIQPLITLLAWSGRGETAEFEITAEFE
jgi:hypothetical protein